MIDDIVARFGDALRSALEEAYQRGAEDMRRRILDVASTPSESVQAEPKNIYQQWRETEQRERTRKRAPRGLLQELVVQVLKDHPGATIPEVERQVMALNAGVAQRSIAGELRRRTDTYFQQGSKWFLRQYASRAAEEKTTVDALRAQPSSTQAKEAVNAAALNTSNN